MIRYKNLQLYLSRINKIINKNILFKKVIIKVLINYFIHDKNITLYILINLNLLNSFNAHHIIPIFLQFTIAYLINLSFYLDTNKFYKIKNV
jgi:hypothetical protein